MLTLVSFVFYGWANPLFSFLLLFSTIVDYVAGLVIALGGPTTWTRPVQRLDREGVRSTRQHAALDPLDLRESLPPGLLQVLQFLGRQL